MVESDRTENFKLVTGTPQKEVYVCFSALLGIVER